MATILSFTPRSAGAGRPHLALGAESSVIIFPGVRYERPGDPAQRGQGATTGTSPQPATPKH